MRRHPRRNACSPFGNAVPGQGFQAGWKVGATRNGFDQDPFGVSARRARAAGYLTKERAPEELTKAVRTVLAGDPYFGSSSVFAPRLGSTGKSPLLPHKTLSAREFQVLRLSAVGLAGKAIAVELGLSQKTVSTYRTRLCRKLGLGGIAELVQYAMRHGLV